VLSERKSLRDCARTTTERLAEVGISGDARGQATA
jgi:hypothetical protein